MERHELEGLVRHGETSKVDLKLEYRLDIGDGALRAQRRSDLAWDIAAMANTRGDPGYLVIGVDETIRLPGPGGAVGISADQVQQIITAHCSPPVEVDVEILPWVSGEPILVITVPRSDRKPHVVKERGCPIRRGATTDHASHSELLEIVQDTGGLDFGRTLVRTASLEDLDAGRVARFLTSQGQPPLDPNHPPEGVLAGHGLARREGVRSHPTAGAVLLFGTAPEAHFPQATVSLVRYSDAAGADPVDRLVTAGVFIDQLRATERFLLRNLTGDYPMEVFREAIVNALIHRDYAVAWAEISVRLLGDQIEVASPGLLIGSLRVEDLARGPIDHPPRRNPSLVNLFFAQTRGLEAGTLYLERAGSGINRMRQRLAERGLPPPEFREDEQRGLFIVSLRGVPLDGSPSSGMTVDTGSLNPRQRQFLGQLLPGDRISSQEYQMRFRVSRATATADLAALARVGLLRARGAGPARRYERPADSTTDPGHE